MVAISAHLYRVQYAKILNLIVADAIYKKKRPLLFVRFYTSDKVQIRVG